MSRLKHRKPSKPYPSFPLTAHNNGQWCKKIRGKVFFFGVWDNPQAALQNYLRVAENLHAGRQPITTTIAADGPAVKEVGNRYLTFQLQKTDLGETSYRWFEDCRRAVESFAQFVGPTRLVSDLSPDDFRRYRQKLVRQGLPAHGKGLGVHALTRTLTIIRGMFKYAYEMDLVDRPIKFGKAFERPSARVRRKSRSTAERENGKRLFEAGEVHALLQAAAIPLRALILLGINGGFGNADCAKLPIQAIDFDRAVIEFDRPKTGIERVVPLWPETLEALHQSLANRPEPADKETADLVFVTTFGRPWLRENIHRTADNGIEVHEVAERFRRSMEIGNVVFCCVDKIDIRRLIWEAVKDKADFFADGRMSAEVLRVLTACDSASRKHYPTTLFAAEEAYTGACTAKTTIYCANIAAGLMLAQFAKWLRRLPMEPDISLNVLTSEITSVAGA